MSQQTNAPLAPPASAGVNSFAEMLYTSKNLHCQLQALGLQEPGFVSTGIFGAAVHTPLVCKHFPPVWYRMTLNCIFSNNVICWCSRNGVQEKKRVTEAFNVFQATQSVVGCLTGGWGLLKRGSSFFFFFLGDHLLTKRKKAKRIYS